MASTGAVAYIRPRSVAYLTADANTGAVAFVSARATSGRWSSAGSTPESTNLRNLRAWLPPAMVPIGYVKGDRNIPVMVDTQSWYKFIDYLVNVVLGGINASTLADVTTASELASLRSAITEASVAIIAQQTQANSDALAAAVQVAQDADLPGADNIPPVQQGINLP